MTENMKLFTNAVRSIIDTKFGDEIPSLDQINEITESYGAGMRALFPMTEDEYLEAKKIFSFNNSSYNWLCCVFKGS